MRLLISTSSFGQTDPNLIPLLERHGFQVTLNPFHRKLTESESAELYSKQELVIAGTELVTREILAVSKSLKFICRLGTGIDNLDLQALDDFKIRWTKIADAHVPAVAELTLGAIIDLLRGITLADRHIRKGGWEKPMGRLLHGKTVGIIGLGKVGKHLCKLLSPFDVNILAHDISFDEAFASLRNIKKVDIDHLLGHSDIVTLHTSSSNERPLIDFHELSLMKPDALLINTSRGTNINEQALYDHLKCFPDFCCYLDVFATEPYNGRLSTLPNCLLTSHIGSYAREVRHNMEMKAVQVVIDVAKELTRDG